MINMKYLVLFSFIKEQQNLKASSATFFWWHFNPLLQ